ncbi:LysE family translocator [Nordella sp. HKS 07]|uniref:LysE family translocator n=1 Tax=Nordella sp. HKS 07 TaxID=2712222 RepID=UPI0013E1AD11|nr:LysE family translocator [Nordella sp. HKS 07]QIG51427.1 LysE family translocator [Nordella sp. HKS 07]
MPLETFLLFAPACFAINMAFGPNNLLSLTNAARIGVAPAILAAAGRIVSFAAMIAIAGVGLGAVLAASETVFTLVKYAGAAYLVWIGINLIRAGAPLMREEPGVPRASLRKLTLQELWVAAGNPKAILVFTAFFPQFVDPTSYALSFTILGATFLAFETVAIVVYSFIGAKLGRYMRDGRALKWFNRTSGAMMIGFGVMLMFTRRPAA